MGINPPLTPQMVSAEQVLAMLNVAECFESCRMWLQ